MQYAAVISLINVFNLSGSIPSDTGDPLVTLTRAPTASAAATSTVSRPPPSVDSDGDTQAHVLEDMETAAFDQASTSETTSKSSRKRDKRRREEECQEEEDTWMRDLRAIMKANQALLEKLVEESPQTDREPFVRFVADTLRKAPQEQYEVMKELIFDIVRQGRRRQPGDSEQPSTLWARTAQAVSAPPTCASSQPFPQPFRQQFSQNFDQPSSCQQYFQQHNPQHQQNWQYGSFVQQTSFSPKWQTATTTSPTRKQFCNQQPNYPQQQQQQQEQPQNICQAQQQTYTSLLNTPVFSQSTPLPNISPINSTPGISSLLDVPSLDQPQGRQQSDEQEDPLQP